MESYLEKLQNVIWEMIQTQYKDLEGGAQTQDKIKLKEANEKARTIILRCIIDSVFGRVKALKEAKIIWNKLCLSYEGNPKTKQTKLMNLKRKYE